MFIGDTAFQSAVSPPSIRQRASSRRVVSGYDINCGCRLIATKLQYTEIRNRLEDLVINLYRDIPSGVGSKGALKLSPKDERGVLEEGARWAVKNGFGQPSDLEATEDGGCMDGADADQVSSRALERGREQLGTLGSGNHFLEIEVVEEIFDEKAAAVFGLEKGQVAVLIHSGSRGLGYQVCDDYLALMMKYVQKTGLVFAGPSARLRTHRLGGGKKIFCRDVLCSQLRLGESPDDDALDPGDF